MKSKRPASKQPTPVELRDELLRFIETHFYPGHRLEFIKDTPRLLKWVVLKLAEYLDDKAVSIPTARYLQIMTWKGGKDAEGKQRPPGILMEALRFGDTGTITYMPAWLGKVVESHLRIHGEEYYEEGKTIRNYLDHVAARLPQAGAEPPNPTRELAQAARLLKTKKKPVNLPRNDQLTMF
jgi:hypothetical protein